MLAVTSKYKVVNRAQRRDVQKYYFKVLHVFTVVENRFLTDVFNDPADVSYHDLYSIYLEIWQDETKRLKHLGWLKHLDVNENYFVEKYYPLESKKKCL